MFYTSWPITTITCRNGDVWKRDIDMGVSLEMASENFERLVWYSDVGNSYLGKSEYNKNATFYSKKLLLKVPDETYVK